MSDSKDSAGHRPRPKIGIMIFSGFCNLYQVVGPPCSTNSESRSLKLKFRNSSGYVGYSGSFVVLLISDSISQSPSLALFIDLCVRLSTHTTQCHKSTPVIDFCLEILITLLKGLLTIKFCCIPNAYDSVHSSRNTKNLIKSLKNSPGQTLYKKKVIIISAGRWPLLNVATTYVEHAK